MLDKEVTQTEIWRDSKRDPTYRLSSYCTKGFSLQVRDPDWKIPEENLEEIRKWVANSETLPLIITFVQGKDETLNSLPEEEREKIRKIIRDSPRTCHIIWY